MENEQSKQVLFFRCHFSIQPVSGWGISRLHGHGREGNGIFVNTGRKNPFSTPYFCSCDSGYLHLFQMLICIWDKSMKCNFFHALIH
jgi:hypothetical protein